ncbi:hypothetical protein [Streptomyces sp. NPDC089799]|uniref:hypothetical protein n=1 Tax=Streptomyces sp. NPDC089799 TaxID=3155066 RepID=UPI003414EB83
MRMRPKTTRTAVAVLTAVLLAGGATACGDKKADGKAADKAGGDRPVVTKVEPAAYLQKVQKNSVDLTSMRYRMSGSSAGQKIEGEASVRLKPTVAMTMKMSNPAKAGENIDIRLIDGIMYLGSEGKFLKVDLKTADPNAAKQLDALGNGGGQQAENPGERANQLQSAKDVKVVGEETVEGKKTTHLSGTVTTEEMRASLATATPEQKESREKSLKQLESQGIKSLAMDMWIGEDSRPVQVRTRGEGAQGPVDLTIKFLDFNQPVDVTTPPADQVVDLSELAKAQGA